MPHVEGDGIGAAGRCGVEVEVDSNEEVARPHNGATRSGNVGIERPCSVVGSCVGRSKFVGQCLVFACTAHGQVLAFGTQGSSFVTIGRDAQLVGDAACQGARQGSTFLKRDARYGNKGQHVGGSHARRDLRRAA